MFNKKNLLTTLCLLLIAVIIVLAWFMAKPKATTDSKTITVTVVHGDGSEKKFTYETAEEYLGAVIVNEGLVVGETTDYGLLIHGVDGEMASWEENQSYWAIVVEEAYATLGADSIALTDGGSYGLVYTIG